MERLGINMCSTRILRVLVVKRDILKETCARGFLGMEDD